MQNAALVFEFKLKMASAGKKNRRDETFCKNTMTNRQSSFARLQINVSPVFDAYLTLSNKTERHLLCHWMLVLPNRPIRKRETNETGSGYRLTLTEEQHLHLCSPKRH